MSTFNELIDFTRSTTGTYLDSVVYGDELVTNGTFDNNIDGWTSVNANLSASNGGMLIADNGSFSVAYQAVSTVIGKTYIIYVDAIDVPQLLTFNFGQGQAAPTGSNAYFDGTGEIINNLTVVGSFQHIFTAVATTTYISFGTNSINAITIDNVSVKEVTGGQVSAGTPLLRTAAINEPRLEYDASGNPLGLLIEEGRTNLVTYSEDFGNGAWSKQSASIATNTTVSPDGTLTGDKLIGNNATVNTEKFANRSIYSYVGQTVTGSVYLKKAEYTWVQINLYNSGAYSNRVWVNLDTGAVGTNLSSIPVTVTPTGDSWYRVALTATVQATGLAFLTVALADADGDLYTNVGDQSSGAYLWGAQLETGSFPTSYIPTSGSTVSRAKDVASLPVERFAYNQPQGSIVCHFAYFFEQNSGNRRTYEFSDGTDSNVIRIVDHNNVNQLQANVKSGGAGVAGILINAPTMLSGVKTFQTYKLNGYSGGADGTLAGTDSNGLLPVGINKLSIGSNRDGVATMSGHITSLQYYPKKLTDAQLELLTQPSASPTMNLTFDGQATSTLVEGLHD